MKCAELIEIVRYGARPVITFIKGCEEMEGYAEPGMRARVTGVLSFDPSEDLAKIAVDYGEFDAFNRPFEGANYFDKPGLPPLTAREAGHYEPNGALYLSLTGEIRVFRVIDDARTALYEMYRHAGAADITYLEWLENRVLAATPAEAAVSPLPEKRAQTLCEWDVRVVGVGVIGTVHEQTEQLARCAALSKFGEEGRRWLTSAMPHIYENDDFGVNKR